MDGGERSIGIGSIAFEFEQSDIDVLALEGARTACFEVVLLGSLSEGVLVVGVKQAGFDGLSVGAAIPVDTVVLDELAAFSVKDNVVVGDDVAIGRDDKSATCGDVDDLALFVAKAEADTDGGVELGLDDLLAGCSVFKSGRAVLKEWIEEFERSEEGVGLFGEGIKLCGRCVDLDVEEGLFVA